MKRQPKRCVSACKTAVSQSRQRDPRKISIQGERAWMTGAAIKTRGQVGSSRLNSRCGAALRCRSVAEPMKQPALRRPPRSISTRTPIRQEHATRLLTAHVSPSHPCVGWRAVSVPRTLVGWQAAGTTDNLRDDARSIRAQRRRRSSVAARYPGALARPLLANESEVPPTREHAGPATQASCPCCESATSPWNAALYSECPP